MKPFINKFLICLVPCLLAGWIVVRAVQYNTFKLGVDLVGGTILVYEVDETKKNDNYRPEEMAASLKRRIDPNDLKNVTIRSVGQNRVEIILPTGGSGASGKEDFTNEDVQEVKRLIAQVGNLEFRILANNTDDKAAITATEELYKTISKEDLEAKAISGEAPPAPSQAFQLDKPIDSKVTYSFVELGQSERKQLGLNNDANGGANWKRAEEARKTNKPVLFPDFGGVLIFSRESVNSKIPQALRVEKKYEYFILVRNPEEGRAITGKYLTNAAPSTDERLQLAVSFNFNTEGGFLFSQLTSKNQPTGEEGNKFKRYLAIILDGQIMTAPSLNAVISTNGQISGGFKDAKDANLLVSILRAGALPATLKTQPVSENSMGATLGEDTIKKGTYAVGIAFFAVMVFMVVYYRFSGVVACIALLANLLLTVGFMVAVNATFTLPGLAGLVLMLGMAVDANVLIYERIREERDRGATLALAIRNGYDRAFPTIIDTHLSSIFTAIVLYTVGNDQLKGFGISLTFGLLISLFTSLYMTRLMFDFCLARGWLRSLSMFRLLTKTNIDFMAIRYYWFTATVVLTLFGITVFLIRGERSLNIDFVGGTAYGGRLVESLSVGDLRGLIEANQARRLTITDVKKLDGDGMSFEITYADKSQQKVRLNQPATEEQVKQQAAILPDWSLVPIYVSNDPAPVGTSRYFTIRTSEKEPDLVQVTIDRLLSQEKDGKRQSLLAKTDMKAAEITTPGRKAKLAFDDFASPGQVKLLLEREFQDLGVSTAFNLRGSTGAEEKAGRYQTMDLDMAQAIPADKFKDALTRTREEFAARPLPERLENFDSQLAKETQLRALYAIVGSWLVILLYLWFRFGNWTFGLATVMCLIHDLCFTLGLIAICHWLHPIPGFAALFQIEDFKIDLPAIAALLTLVGYSVNDTIVVFDRIREVRGKNPDLTPQMINDSVNQTLSRTILTAVTVWLVVSVLYFFGGEGVHLFAFCMMVGVIVGTYSSIYIASPLLLIFGEGAHHAPRGRLVSEVAGAVRAK